MNITGERGSLWKVPVLNWNCKSQIKHTATNEVHIMLIHFDNTKIITIMWKRCNSRQIDTSAVESAYLNGLILFFLQIGP